ncbi:MAG: CHASE domain-containing protein [Opitutus sp.]
MILSVRVFLETRHAEVQQLEAEFGRRADVRNALTRETLSFYESGVYALKSLFEGSDRVSRAEFQRVAADILVRCPGITALEWVPWVRANARAQQERETSLELGRPFYFTEPAPDGTMARAADRPDHYPVLFVEPFAGNERALGYDISNAPTRPLLERARSSQQMVVSGKFQLVQSRPGVVMIWPLFVSDPGSTTEQHFRGFVQGVFRLDEMLSQTEIRSPATATEMLYLDGSASTAEQRILGYRGQRAADSQPSAALEAEFRQGLHREHSIDFGGRKWIVLYRPSLAWLSEQRDALAALRLAVGLLVTALATGLIAIFLRRHWAVQQIVSERTAELSESRRHLTSLLRALPGMAYRCTYKERMSVVYLSEGAFGLTGYQPDEFTSENVHFRDLIHPDDQALVRSATRTSLQTRTDVEVEYRIRPRSGPEKWILSRGRGIYDESGALICFEGLAIDITARKQAEAEKFAMERKLLESQKLESLGLLAGGIAHDFNNLLTGIMGHANLARFQPEVEPEISDHLRKIEAGAARAAELCQQMLAYSGRGNFLIEPVDLNQLVRETLPLLQGSLSSRARLELVLGSEPNVVMADATQLRQIAMNLILNAADALGASGGDITVSGGRRYFGEDFLALAHAADSLRPGQYVFLEVRDTGCGMSAETMAKIFDPFFTTKFTGRGLGLAAVLGIVRGHSGALRVESEVDRGSTFTLLLPPSTKVLPRGNNSLTSTPWKRAGSALVIDDEESVRNVSAALLRSFGLTVVCASNGSDGIERFREDPNRFDLVLLDLTMPGLDGEETLARLRAIAPEIRVLLISGYSENDRITQMAVNGPLLFLQKPFTRGALEQKLHEIFQSPAPA